MKWYYAVNKDRIGPVEDQEFENLVREGRITASTLVWNQNLENWTRLSALPDFPGKDSINMEAPDLSMVADVQVKKGRCTECGRFFPEDELVRFEGSTVCARCKPLFVQKIREGVGAGDLVYAGFWIRFAAKFIDGTIVGIVNMVFAVLFSGMLLGADPAKAFSGTILLTFMKWGVNAAYCTFFLGKFSATPGKMVCGLKVITADNQNVSYLTGFGRFCAEILSALILGIGYLMVISDEEKRALHDRICNTRVIRTR
jgi:uncharacterized RDD family membrane protein YckC